MTLVEREINLQRPVGWLLLDGVLINVASALAWYIRYELAWFRSLDPVFYTSLRAYVPLFAGLTALLLVVLSANGTYNVRRAQPDHDQNETDRTPQPNPAITVGALAQMR